MEPHDLYRRHGDIIESAIGTVCRRMRLPAADAEDFASDFRLRLLAEDYATLRQFQGRSSLGTYLLVVVTRAFQDWRNSRWGKWRPSAEAKRLGPLAERLERLVVRDGYSLDEAHEILRTNLGFDVSRTALEELAARFPARRSRTSTSDQALEDFPASSAAPDAGVEAQQAEVVARAAAEALARALSKLPAEDQLVLRMRFTDGLSVADVGRILHLDQKPLYRRVERLLVDLRRALEAEGLTRDAVSTALANGGFQEMSNDVRLGTQTKLRIAGMP